MGILSDFIAATPEQIAGAFPAWLPVAPEPVVRETNNPFTGKTVALTEWLPAEGFPSEIDSAQVLGDYQHLPNIRLKAITHVELAGLANILTEAGVDETIDILSRPALLDPRGNNETGLHCIPETLSAALAGIDDREFDRESDRWAKSEEMAPHVVTPEECASLLRELARLAKTAMEREANLYLFWSL